MSSEGSKSDRNDYSLITNHILEDIEFMNLTLRNHIKTFNELLLSRCNINNSLSINDREAELLKELVNKTECFLLNVKSKINRPVCEDGNHGKGL